MAQTTKKLYIYDHCPYCVKARMIFGFKKVDLELICLPNDDEKTPQSMIGVKMVPILQLENSQFMPESLDIISHIDQEDGQPLLSEKTDNRLSKWMNKNNTLCYELAMPRWVQASLEEFKSLQARNYFQKKKEAYIGPFKDCLRKSPELIQEMSKELKILESFFDSSRAFFNGDLSLDDFHLFASLRSLSIVKNLSFPKKTSYYSQKISEMTNIPLHHSLAC